MHWTIVVPLIMTYRTHNVFGLAMLVAVTVNQSPQQLGWPTVILAMVANAIGSIAPDLDQASNRLWTLLPGGNLVGRVMKKIFGGHRAVSHSILGVFVFYLLNLWGLPRLLNNQFVDSEIVIIAFMIGYISHVAIDGFTEEGVPLLWPVPWKMGFPPVKSWRIKTGKWFEKWVVLPGIVVWIGWMTLIYWEKLIAVIV